MNGIPIFFDAVIRSFKYHDTVTAGEFLSKPMVYFHF